MACRKGVTLIEIVVVLVIVGVLAAITLTTYGTSINNTNVQAVENNLMAISAAQQKFYEDFNSTGTSYCVNAGANPTGLTLLCGNSLADLTANLHLTLGSTSSTGGFTSFWCVTTGTSFTCYASNPTAAAGQVSEVSVDVNDNLNCFNNQGGALTCP